jgi:hypothetical protein
MITIELECSTCGKTFDKLKGEYNRKIKLGKDKFYCGLSCSGKTPENIENLKSPNRNLYPVWKHSGDREDEFTPFRYCLNSCRQRKDKELDLTLRDLKSLWESQKGICPISGVSLKLKTNQNLRDETTPYQASLDRIDNNLGYIKGNVRFIAVMANFARNKFSDEQLVDFCKEVAENNR